MKSNWRKGGQVGLCLGTNLDKGVLLTCVSRFSSLSAKIIFDLEVVFQMVKHCCCNWDLAKTVVVILVFNLF